MFRFKNYLKIIKEQIIITTQLIKGTWLISKLSRPDTIVTIFGGTHLMQDTPYAKQAHDLAHMLAHSNIPVLTGGGPGIMQAANCGSKMGTEGCIVSMGIGAEGLEEKNLCTQQYLRVANLAARKALLTNYAAAFTVFPGGFGTLDELNEIVTLMKVNKIKKVPILLFDSTFWKPFVTWLHDFPLPYNLINASDLDLFTFVETAEEAYTILVRTCKDKEC